MEKLFVNNNFSYVHLIPVANGAGWTAPNIAKEIASKFVVANANPDHVVVWLDREKQVCGSVGVENEIRQALVRAGANAQRLYICVPDKMTENALLADEPMMQAELNDPGYLYAAEGQSGKHLLRNLLQARGVHYKETFDGVRLLKKMRLSRSAGSSPSIQRFFGQIQHISCWWF